MISIVIPTYNNLLYLRKCIESINKNSFYKNEILVHINEGSDGTIKYLEDLNIKFTHSKTNIGLCTGCNIVSKKSKFDLVLYSHDDMYFLPGWDKVLADEVSQLNNDKFYFKECNRKRISKNIDIIGSLVNSNNCINIHIASGSSYNNFTSWDYGPPFLENKYDKKFIGIIKHEKNYNYISVLLIIKSL